MTLPTLLGEHRRMECCADALERLLRLPEPPPSEILKARRTTLGRLIVQHVREERKLLYPRLEQLSDPADQVKASESLQAIKLLFGDIALHNNIWTRERIETNWEGYCIEARDLLHRLRERIRIEDAIFYPLLLGKAEVRAARRVYGQTVNCPAADGRCSRGVMVA